jgi:hypothetical protein
VHRLLGEKREDGGADIAPARSRAAAASARPAAMMVVMMLRAKPMVWTFR